MACNPIKLYINKLVIDQQIQLSSICLHKSSQPYNFKEQKSVYTEPSKIFLSLWPSTIYYNSQQTKLTCSQVKRSTLRLVFRCFYNCACAYRHKVTFSRHLKVAVCHSALVSFISSTVYISRNCLQCLFLALRKLVMT